MSILICKYKNNRFVFNGVLRGKFNGVLRGKVIKEIVFIDNGTNGITYLIKLKNWTSCSNTFYGDSIMDETINQYWKKRGRHYE